MDILHAVLLGIIEGVTEFLPVSSTGHLTIAEQLLGYDIADPALVAFTAFIQIGATAATLIYFRSDIVRFATAWLRGLRNSAERQHADYRLAWAVIVGSIPIAIVGLLFKDQIETGLRSLWFVAGGLLLWSLVMYAAEHYASQQRKEKATTWRDALFVGAVQCLALIPGVSRSGATISGGLFRGFDRLAATRLAFFLSIPALLAAGLLQLISHFDAIGSHVGWGPTVVAILISFGVAYAAIAWLLRYVAGHSFRGFIVYRVVVGLALVALLSTGVLE